MSVASATTLMRRTPAQPITTTVILPDGRLQRGQLAGDRQARLWAHAIHDPDHGLVEITAARRQRDGTLLFKRKRTSRFPNAGETRELAAIAARHRASGREVFSTPLSRRLPALGRSGEVLSGRVAWVDIDESGHLEYLRAFVPAPRLVVRSGSGGAHAYWLLDSHHDPAELWTINRKLAGALGADLQSAETSRLMRLPGTVNYKVGRPCTIAFCDLAAPRIACDELVGDLADPCPPPPPPDPETLRRWARMYAEDEARRLPPPIYFLLFARIEVPADGGVVHCPLPDHDDRTPSCDVYPEPQDGWHCWGCGRGGSVYDLVSALAGGPGGRKGALRGEQFLGVKRAVHEDLRRLGH